MIWYLLGGLIGIFYFKNKFQLSTWSSISYGVTLAFGLYFGFSTIMMIIVGMTGIESSDYSIAAMAIFFVLTIFCFWRVARLWNKKPEVKIMKTPLKCPRCKAELFPDSVKCYSCGLSLKEPNVEPVREVKIININGVICPRCNAKLFPDSIRCYACGLDILAINNKPFEKDSEVTTSSNFVPADKIEVNVDRKGENEEIIEEKSPQVATYPISPADEIRKFRTLLDDGIITQEEYSAKKKQLLGL